MNLKESFRYQNFIESMLIQARHSIEAGAHCLKITKTHKKQQVNADAVDLVETVEIEDFHPNDTVIAFMVWLIQQRDELTKAIGLAKSTIPFDLDAAISCNKSRQSVAESIKDMLRFTPYKRTEQGRDYKFNVEGNQMPYVYEIEVVGEEAYNKQCAKDLMRALVAQADNVSATIDKAMINTYVAYESPIDVNEDFDGAVEYFASNILGETSAIEAIQDAIKANIVA